MAIAVTRRQVPPPNPPTNVAGKGALHGEMVIRLVTALLTIASLTVALRYYVRFFRVKAWGIDDLLIGIALVCAMGMTACFIIQAKLGSPMGIIGINPPTMKAAFSSFLLYWPTLWAVKMSILTFCYRIFGELKNSRVIIVLRSAMVIITIHTFVAFAMFLFSCPKISTNWDPTVFPRTCLNLPSLQIAHASINACTDAFVLAIPIVMLMRTGIQPRKKAFAIVIFSLGSMSILVSIARVISLIIFSCHPGGPENWVVLPIFASLEINIAITSASLPSLSPLIKYTGYIISQRTRSSSESGSRSSWWRRTRPSGRSVEDEPDNVNIMDLKNENRAGYDYTVDSEPGELSSQSEPSLGLESIEGAASGRSHNRRAIRIR